VREGARLDHQFLRHADGTSRYINEAVAYVAIGMVNFFIS
jgi:hypothetical protein